MNEEKLKRAKQLADSEPDEALRLCNEVMNEDFNGTHGQMALFMSGYIMLQAERYGLAYHIYERCAQLNPNVSEIYSNMGMCLEEVLPQEALKMFQKAFKKNPSNSHALANEGLIHLLEGRPETCVKRSNQALKLDPELRSAKHNRGLAKLMLRDWEEGWKDFYDTLGVKHREKRDYGLPEWDGESPGQVLVYGEQGVGDEIMYASCLEDIMKTNDIVLDCDSRLYDLFVRSFDCPVYGTRFSTETPLLDDHQPAYQTPIGQLPHFYRNSDDSFPGKPYLKPNPDKVIMWRALFDSYKGKKIGIAWNGGSPNTGSKKRSLSASDFEPLFNDEDTFISLEYKKVPKDVLDKYSIKAFDQTLKGGNIDDLAAIISQLDLVVTACTTVVYVAGALGVPCVVLVPSKPGYRYHIEGDFPWYDSVELVRQKHGESWLNVMKRAKKLCYESL